MNHLNTTRAVRPKLYYPFGRDFSPQAGVPLEIADGVFWLRIPLPIALDHINLWLLRDGEHWVIVDSGIDDPVCKDAWEIVFADFLDPRDVSRIIVTHYHPDHIGLAAWLAERCQCKIHLTEGELDRYRQLVERDVTKEGGEIKDFIARLGFGQQQQDDYAEFFKVDDKPKKSRVQRDQCERLQEQDLLEIGNHTWRVVIGSGHSPEHACLYCEELNLLISGDQALPRISSNISVYYSNQDEDPLRNWLHSCAKLRDSLPAETLVLPSHQEPFVGLDLRMQQMIDDHHAQLNKLRLGLDSPMSASAACKLLFTRDLNKVETLLATGETLAHLNYLWHRGEVSKKFATDGSTQYAVQLPPP